MKTSAVVILTIVGGLVPAAARALEPPAPAAVTVRDLAGAWTGTVSHNGDSTGYALEIEPGEDGKVLLKLTVPSVRLSDVPLGRVTPHTDGEKVELGPFHCTLDRASGTLRGIVPEGFAPVYELPFELHRVRTIVAAARVELPAGPVRPAWTFDAGSPMWPGTTFADGLLFAGADDGRLHALDASSGQERWSFRAGGPIRTRVTVQEGVAYFQADDGNLYAVAARTGKELYHVQVVHERIVRLPFSDPASHFDRYGSDVVAAQDLLYLGTHDGRILCLRARDGASVWERTTGGSVLAAPALSGQRLFAGSYDGSVWALDAATGNVLWKHDTHKPVVSTPAVTGGRVIVGSRSYDLLALDAVSGKVDWTDYLWFSWIESSAVVRDGVAYVGSSDATVVTAVEAATGRRLWAADVWGWAWGQPAVTEKRVYIGTCAMPGYPAPHRGLAVAVDRATGRPLWSFGVPAPKEGTYGFAGSPATGSGKVYFAGLDGRVYAFEE
jgi:outer membrane protein assembly factor BamB